MAEQQMSLKNAENLITLYKEEKAELSFQLKEVNRILGQLEKKHRTLKKQDIQRRAQERKKVKAVEAKTGTLLAAKSLQGRMAAKRGELEPETRGRKLRYSDWDRLILKTLKNRKNPVKTATFLLKAEKWAKSKKLNTSESYLRAKVAASLQKLVNKTHQIKKIPSTGRGFAYRLAR
ncbi:MAG: hypothetical protein HKN16_09115 [Saprospiraceae bacterium]|nr:hypothetical protein [Saprospiraceae bacterium]